MDNVRKTVAALPTLSRSKLLELWRVYFGRPAQDGIRREVMVPMLAYRIQEAAYGGLKKETFVELSKLAQAVENRSNGSLRASRLKIGTRIVRHWRGEVYEVSVVNDGFLFRGLVYQSLSVIARRITGTRWSGPLFFGLKNQTLENGAR